MPSRPRHDRLHKPDMQNININLPRWLVTEVKLLVVNPRNGRVPLGGWSLVFEEALKTWLEARKVDAA